MALRKSQQKEWDDWLNSKPKNIRKVAQRIVPWKRYKDKRIKEDVGNRYTPNSYEEDNCLKISASCGEYRYL